MKKLSVFLIITLLISAISMDASVVMADDTKCESYNVSYGEQLDNDIEKMIYNAMVDAYLYKDTDFDNYKGRYTDLPKMISNDGIISFDSELIYDLQNYSVSADSITEAYARIAGIREDNRNLMDVYIGDAMHAFMKDYPQVYWLNGFTTIAKSEIMVTELRGEYTISESTRYSLEPKMLFDNPNMLTLAFDEGVLSICKSITKVSKGYDEASVVKAVHDFVISRVDYNYEAAKDERNSEYGYAFSPLPVFLDVEGMENKVVCQGYAKAVKIICDRLGIQSALLTGMAKSGTGEEYHMWNAVKVDNAWYALDATWDDQKSGTVYTYFLCGRDTVTRSNVTYAQNHLADNVFSDLEDAKVFYIPEISKKGLYDSQNSATAGSEETTTKATDKVNDSNNTNNTNNDSKTDNSRKGGSGTVSTSIEVVYSKTVEYTGTAAKTNITVKAGSVKLNEGTDYKVVFKNNDKVGTATFTITFIGNYKSAGTFTKTYTIKKIGLNKVTVSKVKAKKVNFKKKSLKFSATFKCNGKKLKANKDYKLVYKFNKKKKTVQVTVKGIGNYSGQKVLKFTFK